jgi:Tfp pilus assembly protein PilO
MATKMLGALALLVIAGAGWMFVLGPATAQLADVREQTQAARDQNDLLTLQLLKLKQQAAALDETRAEARALADMFPPTADQPGLFEQVNDAATGAGIGPKNVTALPPTPPVVGGADAAGAVQATPQPGGLAQQTVTVSVEGDFARTQQLLANLEALPRAYLMTSVTMSGGSDTGAFTTTVTGTMFVMPPAPDPDEATSPAPDADEATQ